MKTIAAALILAAAILLHPFIEDKIQQRHAEICLYGHKPADIDVHNLFEKLALMDVHCAMVGKDK